MRSDGFTMSRQMMIAMVHCNHHSIAIIITIAIIIQTHDCVVMIAIMTTQSCV
jgi:hypothetical protein